MASTIFYRGRAVTVLEGADEVTIAGVPYAIPVGHVGVILDDGRVLAALPAEVNPGPEPEAEPSPVAGGDGS